MSGEPVAVDVDARAYLQEKAAAVEAELDRLLPAATAYPPIIHEAMRYSALGGGKRLRAALTLAAAHVGGGEAGEARALPLAAAIEMIHAYSLIHDDLPCMDDDDFRRGKPTCHRVFGEGMAVLAGDALLTHAFEVLARLPELSGIDAATAVRVLQEVARAAGTGGLIGGQVADLQAEGGDPDPQLLDYIHRHKTGALFRACLVAGALVGGAGEDVLAALARFAEPFGLAFQIMDDVLDVTGDAARLGKAVGRDERRAKLTFPRLYGVERSREMAIACVAEARAALSGLPPSRGRSALLALAEFVVVRDT